MVKQLKNAETGTALVVASTEAKRTDALVWQVTDDGATITRMCAVIKRNDAALRNYVKVAAASAMLHAIVHSDYTKIEEVINSLASEDGKHPWRINAVRQWFVDKGPVTFATKPDGKIDKSKLVLDRDKRMSKAKLLDSAEGKSLFIKDICDNPFWMHKPEEKPFEGIDSEAALQSTINRIKNAKKKAEALGPEAVAKCKGLDLLPILEAAQAEYAVGKARGTAAVH